MNAPHRGAPKARIAHKMRGRVRLRLERSLKGEDLEGLLDRIAGSEGVTRVVARPNTGSIIVEAGGDGDEIVEKLVRREIIDLAPPHRTPPFSQMAEMGLYRLDEEIKERTEGAFDFRTSLSVLLLGGAAIQLARGQVAGPATALLVSALSLLDRRKT